MHCKNCGAEAQRGDKFCFSCGAALEEDQVAEAVKKKHFPRLILIIAGVLLIAVVIVLVVISASGRKERDYEEQLKLAERYLDELDYDRAIAAYKAAIEIDPENPEAYLALADVYIEKGDYEAARKILEKGLKRTGDEEFEERLEELEELIREQEAEEKIEALPTPTPTPAPEYESIYEEFLRGERKARVDKSSPSYDYGSMSSESELSVHMPAYELTFSDFLELYKEYIEELYQMPGAHSVDLSYTRYAYIDLGNDGSEELVVAFSHGWEKGATDLEFFVREKDGELEIFTMHESMARGWCGISNQYGLFGGGGSSGASSGGGETGFLDAQGRYKLIYSSGYEYDLNYYVTGTFGGTIGFQNTEDARVSIYSSPYSEKRTYIHSTKWENRTIEDDWAVYNKYSDAFRRYGKELSPPDTEEEYLDNCFKAAGCPEEVRNGPEIEWLNYSDL